MTFRPRYIKDGDGKPVDPALERAPGYYPEKSCGCVGGLVYPHAAPHEKCQGTGLRRYWGRS